ncbi:MAG TPA: helix-hairpin-helix domain-containing protein [Polyangiaceae bacterium]|nr:helix-hairpin-helix domain-containing protein [Polyangiaceae bacterium]
MADHEAHSIDLNTADVEQLTHIEGIDAERARLILDYRREHGPFHDWDDLRSVPGIGEVLSRRVQQAAVIGESAGASGTAAGEEQGQERRKAAEEEEEEGELEGDEGDEGEEGAEAEEEEVTADEDEIEALMAVAQLDLEAAAAYEIAAEQVDDDELGRMLLKFRDDHRRHVDDLTRFAKSRGISVAMPREIDQSVLVGLISSVGVLDPTAALEALIGNEQLTNATYDTAAWLVSDDEALAIVQRNREDERRHLDALTAYAREQEE